jgi:hypothetical protein
MGYCEKHQQIYNNLDGCFDCCQEYVDYLWNTSVFGNNKIKEPKEDE